MIDMHISKMTVESGFITNKFFKISIIASSIKGESICSRWPRL